MTEAPKGETQDKVWMLKFVLWFRATEHKENENVVRARAGLINLVAVSVVYLQSISYIQGGGVDWSGLGTALRPLMWVMLSEFAVASLFGLAVSPIGMLATFISSHILHQEPLWKPARPKRFSWFLGMCMVGSCICFSHLIDDNHIKKPLIIGFASVCTMLTYLEASCGVCVGCWLFGTFYKCMYKDTVATASC